jgi:hypothetical protein
VLGSSGGRHRIPEGSRGRYVGEGGGGSVISYHVDAISAAALQYVKITMTEYVKITMTAAKTYLLCSNHLKQALAHLMWME